MAERRGYTSLHAETARYGSDTWRRKLSIRERLQVWTRLKMTNVYAHHFFGLSAQSGFLLALFGVAGWGVYVVIPLMYGSYSPILEGALQCFGLIVFCEILINWMCIKFVDSSYKPSDYGQRMEYSNQAWNYSSDTESSNLATQLPPPGSHFAWTVCRICETLRPPRCHHCRVCNKCILNRDHHCCFTGSCVGLRNLRHFVVFLAWTSVGTTFATGHMIPYYFLYMSAESEFITLNPFLSVKHAVFGWLHVKYLVLMFLGWLLILFTLVSLFLCYRYVRQIQDGMTSYEKRYFVKAVNGSGSSGDKMKAVFGANWMLNFLVPLHLWYEPVNNLYLWPEWKVS